MKQFYKSVAITMFCAISGMFAFGQAVEVDNVQLDFGVHAEESETMLQVELTNILNDEIAIESIEFFAIYGTNPFTAENVPATIAANSSVVIDVVFSPLHNIEHNTEMVIKTSGNRGAVSVDLLGDCQYTNTYYDDTYDLLDEDLEDALEDILEDGYQEYSYGAARDEMFMEIDNQRVNGQGASENTITRAYLGTDAVGYTSRQDAQNSYNLNTEHTWPQGTFSQNLPMRTDLHHLFVTDNPTNGTRGSYAFGIVENASWSGGGSKLGSNASGTTVFEPRDGHKGKTARAVLYFILRYQNYSGYLTANQEEVLREWNSTYMPTEAEGVRNDDIHDYQNNRNPLTDYPQFSDRIYSYRLDQDRPNTGVLNISHTEIDYHEIALNDATNFNVVLTNSGERFINVSNVTIDENGSGVYALDGSLPTTITLHPGESVGITVTATPTNSGDDLEAMLNITTNLSGQQDINIPIQASIVTGLRDELTTTTNALAPNPFGSELNLVDGSGKIELVRIYDLTGRLCVELTNVSRSIDVSALGSGVYQAVMVDGQGRTLTQKLIKQ